MPAQCHVPDQQQTILLTCWRIINVWRFLFRLQLLLPRVAGMYLISGLAFLIYVTKFPERLLSGRVDYLGHSHQWWHLLVVLALYYWHNTGIQYVEYRMNHGCGFTS
ncbi:hypothetical protein FOCC_FOCC017630 [Frankliniella occidentalis]|nr:hypothetical protein FOCC_FOCC017630 [Frankliniella occidentalis]